MSGLKHLVTFCCVVIILPLTSVAHGQTELKKKPTGSISGHVVVNGKAGAKIAVGAFGGDGLNRRIAAAQTTTDSEGYYHLAGLAADNYQVTTFTANLTPAEPASDFPYGFTYFGISKTVLLGAGEEVNDINIKLVRGGVITGRVTNTENKPLVEERVSIVAVPDGPNRPVNRPQIPLSQMFQTDDRGIYRIYGLPAGRYRVSVGTDPSRGFLGSTGYYQLTYHPDVTDASRATIIELSEGGEASNVDIRVSQPGETYSVSGRVVDAESGTPISGARLVLMVGRGEERFGSTPLPFPTGPDGKFKHQGFTPGRYSIYVGSDFGDNSFYSEPIFFEVVDGNVTGLEIRAIQGLSVNGTVTAENATVKEMLSQLRGLEVLASVLPPDARVTAGTLRSGGRSVVAADGTFQINGLRPGRVSISIASQNPAKRASIIAISYGGIGLSQGFEIQPGQSVSGVNILISYGSGIIRGTVKFTGEPPSGFRTEVICYRQGTRTYAGGAYVDSRGHFQMTGISPGAYDCGLQNIFAPGTARRIAPVPRQTVIVANDVEAEVNFLLDLTPREVGP